MPIHLLAMERPINSPLIARAIKDLRSGNRTKSVWIKRSIKKYAKMINNTGKLSIVAICVWVRCIQSSDIRIAAIEAMDVFFVSCFPRRYIPGIIRIPARAPANRQPKGVMPNRAIPRPMMSLPRGGCVIS